MRRALLAFVLLTAFGCGSSPREEAAQPVLPADALPGMEATTEPLSADDLGADFGAKVSVEGFVSGTERVFRTLFTFRRPRIRVEFSPTFELPPVDGLSRDEAFQMYADEIMCRIAAMLPPEYRGVYAEHPRLKALLSK